VCGAMGFTWEFGLHAYVRRAYLLDSLFGTGESAAERLGSLHLTGEHPVSRLVAL
jgi:alkylation response protein AidB-like acyl-CoA dehydrogenase